MLSERTAAELIDSIELDALGACPMCLFDVAWELHQGRVPARQLVNRMAKWVWLEIEDSLTQAVVQLRMREVAHAEDALYDLEVNGWRGVLVRMVIERLALGLAADMSPRSV